MRAGQPARGEVPLAVADVVRVSCTGTRFRHRSAAVSSIGFAAAWYTRQRPRAGVLRTCAAATSGIGYALPWLDH